MCRVIFFGFLLLYAIAMVLWLIGMFGWLGATKDPLSAVFLIILGQPWVRWVDTLPVALWPLGSAATPAINALILYLICRFTADKAA